MSKVFVVQEPMVRGRSGNIRPSFDVTPAKKFGEIVYLLDWSDCKLDEPDGVVEKLYERLDDIQDGDYLLMSGSPTAMAIAQGVALDLLDGVVDLLMWDKELNHGRGDYKPVHIDMGWRTPTLAKRAAGR